MMTPARSFLENLQNYWRPSFLKLPIESRGWVLAMTENLLFDEKSVFLQPNLESRDFSASQRRHKRRNVEMSRDQQKVLIELLVIQSQAGDPKAFGRLAELLQQELVSYAFRLVGDPHAARDVVQESWLSVLRSIGRLNDPASFRSWVFRIVHNKAVDRLRSVVRERQELKNLERWSEAASGPETAAKESEVAEIRRLINALPTADRALVVLYYENGLSIREVGSITGNTESATKSKLFHIRQKFKLSLSKKERY